MASARVHPPSDQLLSAARAARLQPESPVLSLAGASAGLLLLGAFLPSAAHQLDHWARAALASPLRSAAPAAEAVQRLQSCLQWWLAAPCCAGLVSVLVLRFVAGQRGGKGRLRVRRERPVLWSPRLVALGALCALALPSARAFLLGALPPAEALARASSGMGVLLLVAGLLEAMLVRAAFLHALALTRHEHDALERELRGHPDVRAARRQAAR